MEAARGPLEGAAVESRAADKKARDRRCKERSTYYKRGAVAFSIHRFLRVSSP